MANLNLKHRVRDLIIAFIYYSGITFFCRQSRQKQGPLVRVLCFHDVADRQWFARVLQFLNQNYRLITPDEFKNKQYGTDKINVLLTFDDGYDSWVSNCLPELDKIGARAVFFTNSGLLDIAANKEATEDFYSSKILISPKHPLTWEGARRLLAAGHIIGSHTVSHVRMTSVAPEVAKEEVEKDKTRHEEMLDSEVIFFAYPFGTKSDYNEEVLEVVRKTGIKYQFSAVSGFVSQTDFATIIPRTLIENKQSLPSIKKWLAGSYDLFLKLK